MINVSGFKVSNGEVESEIQLRKRCPNGNTNSAYVQKKPNKDQLMLTNTSKTNNDNAKTTNSTRKITMSSFINTTNASTIAKPIKSSSAMTTKRSLSESSAEEYHRSNETASRDTSNNRKMWHNELIINPDSEGRQPKRRQRPNDDVYSNNIKCNKNNYVISDMIDVGIRVAIVFLFIKLETTSAFQRNIHVEELWLYKNPRTADIVTPAELILSVIISPFVVTLLQFFITHDRRDFRAASWVWTLSLCLNGLTTSLLKITTGRPRPDFFYRCFPDGQMVANVTPTAVNFNCTGMWRDINEGYKSFPSGHSSFAFASFGFISIYLAGKLNAFNTAGRGESWRLFSSVWPLLIATLIAVSRTCDYHHHWQDVLVGGIIGISVAYITYRQYYPSIFSHNSSRPFLRDHRSSFNHSHHITLRHNKHDYLDNSHSGGIAAVKSKDEFLSNEDHMPLICDEDELE